MVKLGKVYKDKFTGFTGTAMARTEYLYGCTRVGLQSYELKDGKPIEWQYFDEQSLDESSTAKTGGPMSIENQSSRDPK